MPANTPRGYPYPLPTEPVAEGAQAIRNLAETIDARDIGMVLLAETALNTTPNFQNIPQTYDALRIVARARSLDPATKNPWYMRYNSDSGTLYDTSFPMFNNGALQVLQNVNQGSHQIGHCTGSGSGAGYFSIIDILIPGYALSGVPKGFSGTCWCYAAQTISIVEFWHFLTAGTYRGTNPITRIDFFNLGGHFYVAGSQAWLYGLRGV
jgi:hypothetical protein